MRIQRLGSNLTEVTIDDTTILMSYFTPVAATRNRIWYRTSQNHSRTTEKHIRHWLPVDDPVKMPQEWFAQLILNI